MVYFTKTKKLWDELNCSKPFPACECGASKEIIEMNNDIKLIQFLMGLNSSYDHVRNQILLMDSLPSVNRAYAMILSFEKQREINIFANDSTNSSIAMLAKAPYPKREATSN